MDLLQRLHRLPLVGILRGIDADSLPCLCDVCLKTGLEFVEITMNTPSAARLIARLVELAAGRFVVGAGTVLSSVELAEARAAGARFVVSPILVREVVEQANQHGMLAFPGALTPQEIHAAHGAGATMVKVFPAQCFGPEYFREIRGPFAQIPLLACGGIRAANISAYFSAGASAVAIGKSILQPELLAKKDAPTLVAGLEPVVTAVRAAVAACQTTPSPSR